MTLEEELRAKFAHCADVIFMRTVTSEDQPVLMLYCEGLADVRQLQDTALPQIERFLTEEICAPCPSSPFSRIQSCGLSDFSLEIC